MIRRKWCSPLMRFLPRKRRSVCLLLEAMVVGVPVVVSDWRLARGGERIA